MWRVHAVADANPHGVVAAAFNRVAHHLHFAAHFFELFAHEALDGLYCILRIGDGLTLGWVSHFAFAFSIIQEAYNGRSRPAAFAIGNNHWFAAFHDGHAGVGGTKVYSYYFSHSRC